MVTEVLWWPCDHSQADIWDWMQTTLLDLLFPKALWYNRDPLLENEMGFLLDVGASHLPLPPS